MRLQTKGASFLDAQIRTVSEPSPYSCIANLGAWLRIVQFSRIFTISFRLLTEFLLNVFTFRVVPWDSKEFPAIWKCCWIY